MAVRQGAYERQAMLSVFLAACGALFTLAGMYFIYQKFSWGNFQVIYSPRSMRLVAIGTALFLGLAGSGAGFLLGLTSAGQRANTRNRLSWTGFFFSALVIAMALSAFIFFYLTRFPIDRKAAIG